MADTARDDGEVDEMKNFAMESTSQTDDDKANQLDEIYTGDHMNSGYGKVPSMTGRSQCDENDESIIAEPFRGDAGDSHEISTQTPVSSTNQTPHDQSSARSREIHLADIYEEEDSFIEGSYEDLGTIVQTSKFPRTGKLQIKLADDLDSAVCENDEGNFSSVEDSQEQEKRGKRRATYHPNLRVAISSPTTSEASSEYDHNVSAEHAEVLNHEPFETPKNSDSNLRSPRLGFGKVNPLKRAKSVSSMSTPSRWHAATPQFSNIPTLPPEESSTMSCSPKPAAVITSPHMTIPIKDRYSFAQREQERVERERLIRVKSKITPPHRQVHNKASFETPLSLCKSR